MDQKAPTDTPLLQSNTHNSVNKELENLPPIRRMERSNLSTFNVFIHMGEHVWDQCKTYLWASIFAIPSSMHVSILMFPDSFQWLVWSLLLAELYSLTPLLSFLKTTLTFDVSRVIEMLFGKPWLSSLWKVLYQAWVRFFVIAIIAMIVMGAQNYLFSVAASTLMARLCSLCIRVVLRQDGSFQHLFIIVITVSINPQLPSLTAMKIPCVFRFHYPWFALLIDRWSHPDR